MEEELDKFQKLYLSFVDKKGRRRGGISEKNYTDGVKKIKEKWASGTRTTPRGEYQKSLEKKKANARPRSNNRRGQPTGKVHRPG